MGGNHSPKFGDFHFVALFYIVLLYIHVLKQHTVQFWFWILYEQHHTVYFWVFFHFKINWMRFIYVVVDGCNSFISAAVWYSSVLIYQMYLFTHHLWILAWFQFWAIKNIFAMNHLVHVSGTTVSLGLYSRVELLDCRVWNCSAILKANCFPNWLYWFTLPPSVHNNSMTIAMMMMTVDS